MIFDNDLDHLSDDDVSLLNSYFDGYNYQASSYTLLANYIWRQSSQISWQIIEDYLCITGLATLETDDGSGCFMCMPMTRTGSYEKESLKRAVLECKRRFESKGYPFRMALIPAELTAVLGEAFGDEITFTHERDDDDYIYLKEDLATLEGRKYHHKKNHLNYFMRTYNYTYEELNRQNLAEVSDFLDRVNSEKMQDLEPAWQKVLEKEHEAIGELLKFVGTDKLLTGVIRIDGAVQAVTIGEFDRTNSRESVLVHIEKASDDYRGLYQAINKEFCMRLPEDTVYVNREEDMGMETLRQTKLSYQPFKLSEKYSAMLK